jgi:hypothetical protein
VLSKVLHDLIFLKMCSFLKKFFFSSLAERMTEKMVHSQAVKKLLMSAQGKDE